MEYNQLIHMPFAKGRIENNLAPAPLKVQRPFCKKWAEAASVLRGNSVAVKCYDNMEPPAGEEYVDGTVGSHPLLEREHTGR